MTFFCLTHNDNLYAKAAVMLDRYLGCKGTVEIDFSQPKPRLVGAYYGVYDFNIAHSGEAAAIAVSDRKIGCDIELYRGKSRRAVAARFTARERAAAGTERGFLENWTAKEAFIKLNGYALATHLKQLEYYDGNIFMNGELQTRGIIHIPFADGMACVCGDNNIKITDI